MNNEGRGKIVALWSAAAMLTLAVTLFTPVPASAGGCQACAMRLECPTGQDCYINEYCTSDVERFAVCGVNAWGECHEDNLCLLAFLAPMRVPPSPLAPGDHFQESSCVVASVLGPLAGRVAS